MFQRLLTSIKIELERAKQHYEIPLWLAKVIVVLPVLIIIFQLLLTLRQLQPLKKYFWGENNLIEMLQFAIFAISFWQGLIISWRSKIQFEKFYVWGFYFLFAAGLLFITLEEIAWGQQFFKFSTPDFIKSFNYQNEFTFHNIESLQDRGYFLNGLFGIGGFIGIWLSTQPKYRMIGVPRILMFWAFWIVIFSGLGVFVDNVPVYYRFRYSILKQTETMELLISGFSWLYLWLNTRKFAHRNIPKAQLSEVEVETDRIDIIYNDGRVIRYPTQKLSWWQTISTDIRQNFQLNRRTATLELPRSNQKLRIDRILENGDQPENLQFQISPKIFKFAYWVFLLVGIVSFIGLILIPRDPKNVWLLGLSKFRLVMVIVHILLLLSLLLLQWKPVKKYFTVGLKFSVQIFQREWLIWLSLISSATIMFGGVFAIAWIYSLSDPFVLAKIVRLTPWLAWFGFGILLFLMISLAFLQNIHRRKLPGAVRISGDDPFMLALQNDISIRIPHHWILENLDESWNHLTIPIISHQGIRLNLPGSKVDVSVARLVLGI
jgi:hypothetical protein